MNHANASHELSLSVKLTIYAFRISDSICFQSNWLKLFYLIYRDNFSQTCKCKLHVRSTSQRLFQERELLSFKKTNPSSVAAINVCRVTSTPPILARSSWTAIMASRSRLLLIFLEIFQHLRNAQQMNDLPLSDSSFMRKEFWDRQGQTLQVARRKCMAKSCFDVQNADF